MPQSQIVTLTNAGGTDTGPFNVYAINGSSVITLIGSNVSKAGLLAGQLFTNVPDDTVTIRVQSNNIYCTNLVDIGVSLTTTTTSTTTSTTTQAFYTFSLGTDSDCGKACVAGQSSYFSTSPTLGNGHKILNTANTGDPAADGYYSNGTKCYRITGGAGTITSTANCAGPTTTTTTTTSTTTTTTTQPLNAMFLYKGATEYETAIYLYNLIN